MASLVSVVLPPPSPQCCAKTSTSQPWRTLQIRPQQEWVRKPAAASARSVPLCHPFLSLVGQGELPPSCVYWLGVSPVLVPGAYSEDPKPEKGSTARGAPAGAVRRASTRGCFRRCRRTPPSCWNCTCASAGPVYVILGLSWDRSWSVHLLNV